MPRASGPPLDMIAIDRGSDTPVYRQLYAALRDRILDGHLKQDTRLPASRSLATDLGLSRNTVVMVYDALLAEGYVESRRGSGTWVANLPGVTRSGGNRHVPELPPLSQRGARMVKQQREPTIPGYLAFQPGLPDIAAFPFTPWTRILASHSRHPKGGVFGYHLVTGHPRLKTAIADYLAVSRGVRCDPEQVIVVTGAQAALDLIGRLLMDEGDHFWIEDPGYLGAHNAFTNAGGVPVPLPVTPRGWALDMEGAPTPRLIFVTPSCQWPLGLVMPMEERLRLLQIAEANGSWIIEDDYDSEYRFRGLPVPALQGLDNSGRVIYVGTFAKTMFPSLRIGFMVVPPKLVSGFKRVVSSTGQYPPMILQLTLAEFISRGFFATHLRRMRRLYAARQSQFVAECNKALHKWLSVREIDTGMQVLCRLTRPYDDGDVLTAARRHGVSFSRLSTQYRHAMPEHGLLLGYAATDAAETHSGIEHLRAAFLDLDGHASGA